MASQEAESYTIMKGDVEAVGAHCQMEYCHVLDFLPFRCESCRGTYCLDHRTEHAHKCAKAGDWARQRAARNASSSLPPKPSLYNHEQQCYDSSCKTLINTPRMPANQCTTCNHSYCLKHRMPEDHDCKNVPRRGAVVSGARQQTMSALAKLKLWAENKRKEDDKRRGTPKKSGFLGMGKSSSSAAATAQAEVNALKRAAKGEASVPSDKRIYLQVEASADTTKAKYPTGKFFYNVDWTVGRVLDMAAKSLQVQNVNNRGGGEEEKLRVFHVEGGRLLKFGEKIGEPCRNGNMIVLLRGVGDGEPDLIDL
ncbi:AN1 zinc finger protein-like protein [Ophiobolus disseminans]|uniref:AN1 zinc finger protein-like protein n=1 Tax=Ophiobolus disseminans TaxID=1469910 RepID=A0A6A6ZTK8_9PLEO|nr:AN1 zinc finger protein-like protein [Ophiobolus disseminans]